jgi:chemotaxis protein MotB
MAKKKHDDHEEHVNHEAWVIPYADLLTLLMGLFLVLWSLGQTDIAKAEAVAAGFTASLGIGPAGGLIGAGAGAGAGAAAGSAAQSSASEAEVDRLRTQVGDAQALQAQADVREAGIRAERADLEEARRQIQSLIDAQGLSSQVQLRLDPEGLVVIATDGLLFAPGSAELNEEGKRAVEAIAEPMRALSQPMRVEGHTDPLPIATDRFPSNWELSSTRASTVLRHLVEQSGFPRQRISAAGYADTRPVASNDTAEGRAANRRVEVVLIAVRATEPLPTGTDGVPGSSGAGGVPAPIGPDGPLGAPEPVRPDFPTAGATP